MQRLRVQKISYLSRYPIGAKDSDAYYACVYAYVSLI